MKINNKGKGALIAAITAAATLLSCGLAAASASAAGVDYLPTIGQVPTYTKFQPTADPGKNASDYFQPYWYAKNANDNGGTHIQAHGGQVQQQLFFSYQDTSYFRKNFVLNNHDLLYYSTDKKARHNPGTRPIY